MTDPDDKTLLEFVARFAGWRNLEFHSCEPAILMMTHFSGIGPEDCNESMVPDYTRTLDGFHRDVWPKIKDKPIEWDWANRLAKIYSLTVEMVNASARNRCLALWRALAGKLPTTDES